MNDCKSWLPAMRRGDGADVCRNCDARLESHEPAAFAAVIEAARTEVYRNCQPYQDWRMTIPVDGERDSDIVIGRGLNVAAHLCGQLVSAGASRPKGD